MTKAACDPLCRRHRFPPGVIARAVWLYFRFPLGLWMVEDLLATRGIVVSHQSVVSMGGEIRAVALKFTMPLNVALARRTPRVEIMNSAPDQSGLSALRRHAENVASHDQRHFNAIMN
jgi:putative transposase